VRKISLPKQEYHTLAGYHDDTDPLVSDGDWQRLRQVAGELSPCFLLSPRSAGCTMQ